MVLLEDFEKKNRFFTIIQLSCSDILDTQNKINKMPREIFNWKSSLDLFKKQFNKIKSILKNRDSLTNFNFNLS